VNGNGGDKVNVESGWAQGDDQVVDEVTYHVYTKGTEPGLGTLLVASDVQVV
jgi:hypothetical protein